MRTVVASSGTRRGKPPTAAELLAARDAERAEQERKYRELYGEHFDLVQWLRPKVGLIVRHGAGVKVDSRVMSFDELVEFARKKGWAGQAPVASAGLPMAFKASPPVRKLSGAAAAAHAKAQERSTDLGKKPKVVWLDLGLLEVDHRYQREITQDGRKHIGRILKDFNWNKYQPVVVTESGEGKYAVIDGQHRLEAAKKHPLIDSLPCYVIDAPDLAAQAEIFIAVNSDRRGLTGLNRVWAAVASGNVEAAAIAEACEKAGVTIPRNNPSGGLAPRTLIGAYILLRYIGKLGRAAVLDALALCAEAWPERPRSHRISIVVGVARVCSTPYSRERLLRALRTTSPEGLNDRLELGNTGSGALAIEGYLQRRLGAA